MRLPRYLTRPTSTLDLMLYWAGRGWPVVPLHTLREDGTCTCPRAAACDSPGKHPRTQNGVKDATTDPAVIERWAKQWPQSNVGGSCAGRLILDIDLYNGGKVPDDLPPTRTHWSGRGDGSRHLVFMLSSSQRAMGGIKSNNTGKYAKGIDVRTGSNSYVVLPGSKHVSGGEYTEDDQPAVTCPDSVLAKLGVSVGGVSGRSGTTKVSRVASRDLGGTNGHSGGGDDDEASGGVTSLLAGLLANPAQQGDRNNWLTRVAGHYAKTYRRQRDLYDQMVIDANAKLTPPMSDHERDKVARSVWRTEQTGHPERDALEAATAANGYLLSGDYGLKVAAMDGPKDDPQIVMADWADFDLRVNGTVVDPHNNTLLWDLTIMRGYDRAEIRQVVESSMFGDPKKTKTWLASFGLTIAPPPRCLGSEIDTYARLIRYLRTQESHRTTLTQFLGWDWTTHRFITVDGQVDAEGVKPPVEVVYNPKLASSGDVPYRYGQAADQQRALSVLREVLTYHDEQTAAVFGSWWAAVLVKPHIMRAVSLFPIAAVEAASGSGKTNGYFPMMVALSGNSRGAGFYTTASLRNALSLNRNGIVWVDDLDDPKRIQELVRAATSGESLSKLSENRVDTVKFELVGSLLLSGESLAIAGQKALTERAVLIKPTSPTGRTSLKPGRENQPQWDDIVELDTWAKSLGTGGLAEISGWLVAKSIALIEDGTVDQAIAWAKETKTRSGRVGERDLVLLAGARVLEALADLPAGWAADRVAAWIGTDDVSPFDGDNTLTTTIIPWAIRRWSFPTSPRGAQGGKPVWLEGWDGDASPPGVDGAETLDGVGVQVWISPRRLAECWAEHKRGAVDERTETERALRSQAEQIGCKGSRLVRTGEGRNGARGRYLPLPAHVVGEVLRRAAE